MSSVMIPASKGKHQLLPRVIVQESHMDLRRPSKVPHITIKSVTGKLSHEIPDKLNSLN